MKTPGSRSHNGEEVFTTHLCRSCREDLMVKWLTKGITVMNASRRVLTEFAVFIGQWEPLPSNPIAYSQARLPLRSEEAYRDGLRSHTTPSANENGPIPLCCDKKLVKPPFPFRFDEREVKVTDQCCCDLTQFKVCHMTARTGVVTQPKLNMWSVDTRRCEPGSDSTKQGDYRNQKIIHLPHLLCIAKPAIRLVDLCVVAKAIWIAMDEPRVDAKDNLEAVS